MSRVSPLSDSPSATFVHPVELTWPPASGEKESIGIASGLYFYWSSGSRLESIFAIYYPSSCPGGEDGEN